MSYQSHDGGKTVSDSSKKLERLHLPDDMSGMRLLDIGCNEGFFCAEAVKRGATHVVGIDAGEARITKAIELYGDLGITFLHQRWDTLPEGPFDFVLWLSAMHYEWDPASVFRNVLKVLSPRGVLVLECGVHKSYRSQMIPVARTNDVPLYPTMPLLQQFLSDFVIREVSLGKTTPGDSVPRHVLHCWKRKTTVLLVRGGTKQGKTDLGRLIDPSATKVISLDRTGTQLYHVKSARTPLQQCVKNNCDRSNLEAMFKIIDAEGLTEEYVKFILRGVVSTDKFVVIEGFMTDLQVETLTKILKGRAIVWDARRRM